MTGAPSSPSSPTMPCRQPTTRPSAPCAWPSSPGASASEREPRKGAPPTPPPCPSLKPAEGAASIPGHTSLTLSPAPERTCITSRFLSQFERKGGERLRRRRKRGPYPRTLTPSCIALHPTYEFRSQRFWSRCSPASLALSAESRDSRSLKLSSSLKL